MANTPFMKNLQKHVITGVLLGFVLMYNHYGCVALAASGGRMGGRLFYSSSLSSSSTNFSTQNYYYPTPVGGDLFFVSPAVKVEPGVRDGLDLFFMILVGTLLVCYILIRITQKTSVLKLQVGLSSRGRSLQRDLNRIAETSDTSKPEGLNYVLQETTLTLLRHPDYCISGYSSVDTKRSIEQVENRFNQLSIEERAKFNVETPVIVNNIRKQRATTQRSNDLRNEYIVITIIVAAEGAHKLPLINSSAKLKEALQKLATISSRRVKAVEVLWTPQSENDTLTERQFLEDYSLLRPLSPQG